MTNTETLEQSRSPRTAVAAMMALSAMVFFVFFLLPDLRRIAEDADQSPQWGLVLRYVIAMAIGGALAGAALSAFFGRTGIGGWVLALLGAVLATSFAGMLGSAVGFLPDLLSDGWHMSDLIPILYGLLIVPLAFAGQPLVPVVWFTLTVITHLRARSIRQV